jgi:hypothetical protein
MLARLDLTPAMLTVVREHLKRSACTCLVLEALGSALDELDRRLPQEAIGDQTLMDVRALLLELLR